MSSLPVIRHVNNDASEEGVKFFMKSIAPEQDQPKIQGDKSPSFINRQLEDELRFWKLETSILLRLLWMLDRKYLTPKEKSRLSTFEREFSLLLEKIFLAHELELVGIGEKLPKKHPRSVKKSHQKLRRTYQQLKMALLPLLPKMIPVTFL